ncbi:hypothetical protein CRG98_006919 [Punica granatum]|uniref:RNA helicase n=1 Tax=Punica granatum TaxID=22663 RepID=A0A2I0KW33_PUNGR|nr:hypothetical protein CRG98_006919 [Punica granatum]
MTGLHPPFPGPGFRRRTTPAPGRAMPPSGTSRSYHGPSPFPHNQFLQPGTNSGPPPPSFSIFLRPSSQWPHLRDHRDPRSEIQALVDKCDPPPVEFLPYRPGRAIATLVYRQWTHARDALLLFWSTRLNGEHALSLELVSPLLLPSDKQELNESLKALFLEKINGLLAGEQLRGWQKKLDSVLDDLAKVRKLLKRPNRLGAQAELSERERGLVAERELITKRIREFKAAMNCIRAHLEGKPEELTEAFVPTFKFATGDFIWNRIHHLILRECKRLDDGLPIYAHRQEILKSIYLEQIMVLIGETGSGKSTQLAQFIADAGMAKKSIVCTQPRKIAAISLTQRVREESSSCYEDNSVICYPTFSSSQSFCSNVVYMTDHCLLQHYMSDNKLSGISCIIIDEAHERSLNTDLLLARLKFLLAERDCLRLIIMSATADAKQLSDYFYECKIMHVVGRNYPVEIRYAPILQEGSSPSSTVPLYVSEAVRMAKEVHRMHREGTILAFLTSQAEVEWACKNFLAPSAVALPLHGKLTHEEQQKVFQSFSGIRKVIFATNLAETSLTIPGVKYAIDSGMVKESKFEATTGMNILRVCTISKSSANQRAGRAGRTEPGVCYRLYSSHDFESMDNTQEPEIRRVHLGIAVLRILAFGTKKLQEFEFIDAPSDRAIDMAIRNLVQLGAVIINNDSYDLTSHGRCLLKLGIEPRLGKLIYSCLDHNLGIEGVVLAAVMANSSSIFCRVGSDVERLKADSLKVQFCHQSGDLFTLLSVYKNWEAARKERNSWCWENSINAKTMRRCHETVKELKDCLWRELGIDIPSLWRWDPHRPNQTDKDLKKVILSCLAENVAMYSGHERLGYEVAITGQQIQLHPSCSLLVFGEKPSWVVFSEILSVSSTFLVCVTAFDFECLSTLCPPPLFDSVEMECRRLQRRSITGFGGCLLRKFCGKFNSNLHSLVSRIRAECSDDRASIEVDVDQNEVLLFASSKDLERVCTLVNDCLEYERKLLQNECIENPLYHGPGSVPVALLGAGAVIKHIELEKNFLSVDVYHPAANSIEDKELLMFLEESVGGSICSIHKFSGSRLDEEGKECWGRLTFTTPEAARQAVELSNVKLSGAELKLLPSRSAFGSDTKAPSHGVKVKICWPRRPSKGVAFVAVKPIDVVTVLCHFSDLVMGGQRVYCDAINFRDFNIAIKAIPKELSEPEILDVLANATNIRILDCFLRRGQPVGNPSCTACEEALLREISPLMPRLNSVEVIDPEDKDAYMKAFITFDARLHLEAAAALESLRGKVLPGFLPWQKIQIQQQFHSTLSCASYSYERTHTGGFRVKISANATRTVAELRRPIEALMQGKIIDHADVTPSILQILFSREGVALMKSVQRDTRTYILFDRYRRTIKMFGPSNKVAEAEERLVRSLLELHECKQLEIHLRRRFLPSDLMKELVTLYGPDLRGLKEMVPGAEFTLNARRHIISIQGEKDAKQKVEEIISEIVARRQDDLKGRDNEASMTSTDCPICLCTVEDGHRLEGCSHLFCRSCLVEQCESAIKDLDILPICCAHEGCNAPVLITDLKTLLPTERLEELFRASLGKFVATSGGLLRFCPSPDCPSIYRVGTLREPFICGACFVETCTSCHLEYHPSVPCERYKQFKEDPDLSLKDWCQGKEYVKVCPVCGYTIEKVDGCNHMECRCGRHICWVCLKFFSTSDLCYEHLRSVHAAIN